MNLFIQVKDSVIDFKSFLKVKDNRFGKTFTYLLLLLLIVYSMTSVKWYNDFSIITKLTIGFTERMPDFRLEKGEFTFSGTMPYEIMNIDQGKFIIDTTGKTTIEDYKAVDNGILIAKDFMMVRNAMQERKIYFKDMTELKFHKQDIINILPRLPGLLAVFLIFGFLFALIWKLLNVLILAVIGILLCKTQKTTISFKHLFNLAAYSLTLPILLQLALTLSGVAVPYFGLLYWFISIMYLFYGIKYVKNGLKNDEENGVAYND